MKKKPSQSAEATLEQRPSAIPPAFTSAPQLWTIAQIAMKISYSKCAFFCVAFLSLAVSAHADAAAYAQILRDRDATLSKILQEQESRFAVGAANGTAVLSAKLALYSFRRDTASTVAAKMDQQKAIVSVYEERQASVKAQLSSGLGDSLDLLLVTDQLLQAKQFLEELQASAEKG